MNKKGFTLIEIISVIALLGIIVIITIPTVMKTSKLAKERTLKTKIENIEKAAVLYGQDNRNLISKLIKNTDNNTSYKYCFKEDGNLINNCYYMNETVTLGLLIDPNSDGDFSDGYIKPEKDNKILNPTNEAKNLNNCPIQIYQKYGKIYAVYLKKGDSDKNTDCWINE